VGDEPLLLSAFGPVWVAKDRAAGANAAKSAGAAAILLDDGFQNPSLTKTKSLIVVDAQTGFGNGKVMPAGPLREPVQDGLKRADMMIVIGPSDERQRFIDQHMPSLPIVEAELEPLQTGMDWTGLRVLAFAGIGRPQKFYDSLKRAGAEIVETRSFGDHAPYRADLLRRLLAEAKAKNAQLVTTEKDAVRLPSELRAQVLTFPVRLKFIDDRNLEDLFKA
jgi:tetraacyldisaccharide 4'-kinase